MRKFFMILLLFPIMAGAQNYIGDTKQEAKKHFNKDVINKQDWTFQDSIIELLCCRYESKDDDPITDTMQVWIASKQFGGIDTLEYYFTSLDSPICDSISMKFECDSCANFNLRKMLFYDGYRWVKLNDSVYAAKYYQYAYMVPTMIYRKPNMQRANPEITIYLKWMVKEEYKSLKKMKTYKRE